MATYSKTINNGWGTFNLELRQTGQSIANNTSTVSYKLYISSRNNASFYNNYHTGKTSIVINGATVHNQTGRDFNVSRGGSQQLASGTTTVKHNEDGSKTFSFSASIWASNFSGNISGNFSLTKIPRKSDFYVKNENGSGITRFYAGDKVKVEINKKVSSFTHTLSIKYLNNEETLISKTSSSNIYYTDSYKIMGNYMQNLRSMPIDFVLRTYDGNTEIGYELKRLSIDVPDMAKPTINEVEVKEDNQNKINIIGQTPFYQLLSDLNVITDASAKYGASIKNINVSLGSITRVGSNVKLEDINLSGYQDIKVMVQDSRGFSTSTTKSINLSPYAMPNIAFFNAYRKETNTRYASARISLTSTVINNKNPLEVRVDVAEKDSNSWRNVYSATVGNGAFNSTISLGRGFDDYKAYDVRLSISDKFKRHQAISNIPATSQSLVIGANKPVVGIGKVPSIDKGLEVDGDIFLNGEIKLFGEAGKIINLNLANGLSGFIKTRKDAFGGVSIWGKVKVNNSRPIKKYYTWATLPSGYNCNRFIGFSLYSYVLNGRINIIPGMGLTDDGRIRYIGINNEYDKLETGSTNEFNIYFKAEGVW